MKSILVSLPDDLATSLERLASDVGETRNGIIRHALEEFIASARKRRVASEMKEYAEKMAGRSGEFVEETGTAVARKILKETRW